MKRRARKLKKLYALRDRVAARPRIAAYLASPRRVAFNETGIFRHYPELERGDRIRERLEAVRHRQWAVRHVSLADRAGRARRGARRVGQRQDDAVKMINRLSMPTRARCAIAGKDVRDEDPVALRRTIGYVIQQVGLLPHLTVADNIAMVPRLLGWTEDEVRARVDELLDAGRAAGRDLPRALSPTSCRAASASGSASRARSRRGRSMLLLDEPFGALDPITRVALQGELRRIHKRARADRRSWSRTTSSRRSTLADRIAVMCRGELRQLAHAGRADGGARRRLRRAAGRDGAAPGRAARGVSRARERAAARPAAAAREPPRARRCVALARRARSACRSRSSWRPAARSRSPVVAVAGVVQTIPGLALLALMVAGARRRTRRGCRRSGFRRR